MLQRAYKFRLDPTPSQEIRLQSWLSKCCELYNACLQERRDAWSKMWKSIGRYDQMKELPAVKAARPDVAEVNAQVLQEVCARVDRAFQGFFRRVRAGQKPGHPRFRSWRRYDSFTHPQAANATLADRRIRIPSFGHIRWRPWRSVGELGTVKTLTIKREADGWYAILSCEIPQPAPLPAAGRTSGLDVGLRNLVTTSTGAVLGDLTPLKAAERRLRRTQKIVSRRVKGSNRRRKAVGILARRHQNLARARKAQLDIISRSLVVENDVIFIEDLSPGLRNAGPKNAQGRGMRRNWRHAAIGMLTKMLDYKAESAGRRVVRVDPAGTTVDCSRCENPVPKTRKDRVHRCSCGLVLDRDWNAAINIEQRGLRLLRGSGSQTGDPSGASAAASSRKTREARRSIGFYA